MTAWLRGIGSIVVPVIFGGLLAGCEGGGSSVVRLYFGINGQGDCDSLVLFIDQSNSGAVVARHGDGSYDCVLDAALEAGGCEATFAEVNGGDLFEVMVTGCTIPDISSIVQCDFDEVDVSELFAGAACSCASDFCDVSPPVCFGEEPDPASCEDCHNEIDDDDNGRVDCEDPNCSNDPTCHSPPPTHSSSTTSSVTSTSTTVTDESTSTTMPFRVDCTLTYRLADDVTVGSLQWSTDYSAASGFVLGEGATVECASLVEGTLAAFNDNDAEKSLEAGLIKVEGFTGPINVAECRFLAQSLPLVDQFVIGDVEAAAPDLTLIVPAPDVVIGSIECPVVDGPSTTTTISPPTTLPEASAIVLFRLDSASSGLGALQFSADYSGAAGGFQGSGATVACTNKVLGSLFAPNDDEVQEKLTLGLIALSPFSAPIDLVECRFEGGVPAPGDLLVTVEDATNIDGEPATAAISVAVTPAP